MKTIALSVALGLLTVHPIAAEASSNGKPTFAEFSKKRLKEYHTFKNEYLSRYQQFKAEVRAKWGVADVSSSSEFIHYSDDMNVKLIGDFQNDFVEVSILDTEGLSEQQISQKIEQTLALSLDKPIDEVVKADPVLSALPKAPSSPLAAANNTLLDYLSSDISTSPQILSQKAILVTPPNPGQALIDKNVGKLEQQIQQLEHYTEQVSHANLKERMRQKDEMADAKNLITELEKEKETLTTADADKVNALLGKNMKTYRISLDGARVKRAEHFLASVKNNANKWQLDPELILAIMETESSFNPVAQSPIPAFGLMQVVPSTAGLDVNRRKFQDNNKPSQATLFNSTENIKFGSAYLNILLTSYLNEVKNPVSRLYCAIAAYNTGIGNLARAFNKGDKNRKKAIAVINTLTPDEVYQVIQKRTHTETQRYLVKVLNSKQYFAEKVQSL
ncbi:transglycosylase SLT domain-containing protein [Thalassotalea maritima]|uniref:transglycosylase SLT domain-containing protein n=1 Tax=Thalassotalea maritima TaxID=3242416 RepID=UPI0035295CC0